MCRAVQPYWALQISMRRLITCSHPVSVYVKLLSMSALRVRRWTRWLSYVFYKDRAVKILDRQLQLGRGIERLNTECLSGLRKVCAFFQGYRPLGVLVSSVEHLGYKLCWHPLQGTVVIEGVGKSAVQTEWQHRYPCYGEVTW